MDRQFLVERQQGLQVFLNAVIADPLLHRYVKVKKFLDPVTYAENFYGEWHALLDSLGFPLCVSSLMRRLL